MSKSKPTPADVPTESAAVEPLTREQLVAEIGKLPPGTKELRAFATIAEGRHGWEHPAFRGVWLECLGVMSTPPAK